MNRRSALGVLAAGFSTTLSADEKPAIPTLCVLSRALAGIGYAELGDIVKQLGFDGVDLTVMPGGHVEPALAPVDEVRALESIHGAGLKTPLITTAFTNPNNPHTATVLALAGRTGVSLFKSGLTGRIFSNETRRDAYALSFVGREYSIALCLPAGPGENAFTPTQAKIMLNDLDPKWSGLALSSSCFAADRGWSDTAIEELLPRVTAVSIADFVWREQAQDWRPLGQGSVDFGRMFSMLARAKFAGPLSVSRDYPAKDAPGSLARDAQFLRKQIQSVT